MSRPGIGVHLPHAVPGVDGATVLTWARNAEAAGFRSLAVAERLNYDNCDAIVTLAAAAAATTSIPLLANILIPSLRPSAVFAKEVATLSRYAPGRLTVGVAAGARPQDYESAGVPWIERGWRVDAGLDALFALADPHNPPQSVGPVPDESIEVLVGGVSKGAIDRMLKYGHGYVGGGLKPEFMAYDIAAVKAAWDEASKPGQPRIVAGTWFASESHFDEADAWRNAYLEQGGPPEFVRSPISRGADEIRSAIDAYAALGATEIVLFGGVADPAELDWLADALSDYLGS